MRWLTICEKYYVMLLKNRTLNIPPDELNTEVKVHPHLMFFVLLDRAGRVWLPEYRLPGFGEPGATVAMNTYAGWFWRYPTQPKPGTKVFLFRPESHLTASHRPISSSLANC
jgi:hypothetical protein